MADSFKIIEKDDLPTHFDAKTAELEWHKKWQQDSIFKYDENIPREQTYIVDTPPPTASGSLHIGHAFSYTHTDILVRYQRMIGKNIYYPMGWDDNGLPTERRVQNYYHVWCDADVEYDPNLELKEATNKEKKKNPAKKISRLNFIELCQKQTKEDEIQFHELFSRLGLSVDWNEEYQTINEYSRKTAQKSFLELFKKNELYSSESPCMWDIDFQTAIAQAEIEDREIPGAFYHIKFGIEDSNESFTIATTRPELLPGCIGITAHPEDERYKHLFGKYAISPIFKTPILIFESDQVKPEKGTGILMVCTFGDTTDVEWWKEKKLPLRQILNKNGRLLSQNDIKFGTDQFPSKDPEFANQCYSKISEKDLKNAKKIIIELLKDPKCSSTSNLENLPPLEKEPENLTHSVKFFEKGNRPLEIIATRQWFVKTLDKKQKMEEKCNEINWYPIFTKRRFLDWNNGLKYDWCISRQRFFGVPIPVWYKLNENREIDFKNPILPELNQLPIDPSFHTPNGFNLEQRNQPNGFIGESDVFDTWFTSSLTPFLGSKWANSDQEYTERHKNLYPTDLRPQSHEIIRTWAYYTILKSLIHENSIPWKNVAISGWILDPDRKKMSKSKGNVTTPLPLIEKYSADGVRYWAGSAKLGSDTAYDEDMFKNGKRLSTKLYNATKLTCLYTCPKDTKITDPFDIEFVSILNNLTIDCTNAFEQYNFSSALSLMENFFWHEFTGTYLELAKSRITISENEETKNSAIFTLRKSMNILLRLFAPFLPFITEEMWTKALLEDGSIHKARWPSRIDFENINCDKDAGGTFNSASACLEAIQKYRTVNSIKYVSEIEFIKIQGNPKSIELLSEALKQDIMKSHLCKVQKYEFIPKKDLKENEYQIC